MKKAILIAIVIAVCLTLALSLTVSAGNPDKSGPAEKATGWVSSGHTGLTNWYVEFAAHEEIDNLPAGKGTMRHWNDTINEERELLFEVKYVDVDGDMAWFAGECIYDNTSDPLKYKVGHWVFVEVKDGGEPGIGVDYLGWCWPGPNVSHGTKTEEEDAIYRVINHHDTMPWWEPIDEGNLQVHTR